MKTEFKTSQKMLDWQYASLIGELTEIQRHASDPTCPCRLSDDLGENCLAKHSLAVFVLAAETAAMELTPGAVRLMEDLSAEAKERHEKMRGFLCHKVDEPEFTQWSRQWRKKLEPLYYHQSCKNATFKQAVDLVQEKVTGSCNLIKSEVFSEQRAEVHYRNMLAAAKKDHLPKEEIERLKTIAQQERDHQTVLSGIVQRNCPTAGVKLDCPLCLLQDKPVVSTCGRSN